MKINVKKYVPDKTLIFDRLETYPAFVFEVLRKNESLIRNYYKEQKQIEAINKKLNYFPTENPNKYLSQLNDLANDLAKELIEQGFSVLAFHCTHLVNEEIQDIKENGFKLFNKEAHYQKLDILSEYDFTEDEIKQLKKLSYAEQGSRENKVYFNHNISTLNTDCGLSDILEIWGGEITFWDKDLSKELINKLKEIGSPCVVISKIQLLLIPLFSLSTIIKSLISHLYNGGNIQDRDTYLTTTDIPILDVIIFDRENGDVLVYE